MDFQNSPTKTQPTISVSLAHGTHSGVLENLGQRIAGEDVTSGQILTVAELETEYQVSRTVIREAVRVLESAGMIVSKRRVGLTIQPYDRWDSFDTRVIRWVLNGPRRHTLLESLTELRFAVEPVAARLAAMRAPASTAPRLVEAATNLIELAKRRLGHSKEFLEVDVEFHSVLINSSQNPLFASLSDPICETLKGRTALGLTPAEPDPSAISNHLKTALAILNKDPKSAEKCARGYVVQIWDEVADSAVHNS